MNKVKAPERREPKTRKSPAEIPPAPKRKHLTEPSWIENMIYFAGVCLGQESEEDGEESPPKSEAA